MSINSQVPENKSWLQNRSRVRHPQLKITHFIRSTSLHRWKLFPLRSLCCLLSHLIQKPEDKLWCKHTRQTSHMSNIWKNCVSWSNLTHIKCKTIAQSMTLSACVSVLCILCVCVCVCPVWGNHRVNVQGNVFTSPGLSVAGRDPLMPTGSSRKNAFGMLNWRSK